MEPAATELQPGEETTLDVAVVDANGMPVENAELAVVVVDEAILALTNYTLANPLDTFYRPMSAGVDSYYGRNSIVLASAAQFDDATVRGRRRLIGLDVAEEGMGAPMPTMAAAMPAAEAAAADDGARRTSALADATQPRKHRRPSPFAPTSTRWPSSNPPCAPTQMDSATIEIKLPDNLTRYRVMVSAVAGDKLFGAGRDEHHRPAAAHGTAGRTALPQLRRPLRAAHRHPESDRRAAHRRRRPARRQS